MQFTGNVAGRRQRSGNARDQSQNMTPLLEMPDPDKVFEYYLSNGTPISYGQLASGLYRERRPHAGNNPYGTHVTNVQGSMSSTAKAAKSSSGIAAFVGTLVFVNASAGSTGRVHRVGNRNRATFPP